MDIQDLLVAFLSGFIISLSGSLAPSNMSAAAMELTLEKGKKAGLLFGLGSALVEMIYIRLYFLGFDAFIKQELLFLVLQWVMIGLFFTIGIILFINTFKPDWKRKRKKKDFSTYTLTKAFLLGVFLKAINPLQFVFWTFWISYLMANNWLKAGGPNYSAFCIGLALATYLGFVLYVFLGGYLETKSFFSRKIFRRIIAAFLSLTSVAWGLKLIIKPEGLVI